MERIFIFSLIFTITKGFMFDQLSDKLRCQGISMMCPPMCLVHDSSGCSTCDCSNMDPSHPKLPGSGNTGGNNVDPSNPLSGHNNFPGSAGCGDWTKCACVPTVNAASGCLECPCGQVPVTNTFPTTKPTQPKTTTASSTKPTEIQSPGNQPNTHTFSHAAAVTRPFSHTSVLPSYVKSSSTSKPAISTTSTTSTVSKTSAMMTSAKVTSPEMDTNLPSIATIPSMNTVTTMLTTSTLAPFVCPGVFSCSLDCYAGFAMDKSGCPLCQCAPIPTDLP